MARGAGVALALYAGMNKQPNRKKLSLSTSTVRQLSLDTLEDVAGGETRFTHHPGPRTYCPQPPTDMC
jgi:hypothetical protein